MLIELISYEFAVTYIDLSKCYLKTGNVNICAFILFSKLLVNQLISVTHETK